MLKISKIIQNYPKLFKIIKKYLKNIQNYPYIYLYIYGFSGHRPGSALASSGRGLDATERGRDVAKPKKTHARTGAKHLLQRLDAPKTQ